MTTFSFYFFKPLVVSQPDDVESSQTDRMSFDEILSAWANQISFISFDDVNEYSAFIFAFQAQQFNQPWDGIGFGIRTKAEAGGTDWNKHRMLPTASAVQLQANGP